MAKAQPAKKKVAKKKTVAKKAPPKKTMGRPTKYSLDILKRTKEYIESCEDETTELFTGYTRNGGEMFKEKLVVKLPNIEGLAYTLKISKDTIYEWCKIHKDFSDVIKDLLAKQANVLLTKGLSGDYNPTIAKVLLTKHGYREGIEQSGKDGGAIEVDVKEKLHIEGLLNDIF